MILVSIILIIVLIYFLIIRPLTNRNRPQIFDPRRGYYDRGPDYYGPEPGGLGRFGTFAGGFAAGALLTYLFEQGRIGFDQFNALQNLEDHEIMRELLDQNIIQEHEIDQLQEELHHNQGDDYRNWDGDRGTQDDNDQYDYQDQDDGSGWDNGDDNWV
ncbi:hypothetical protein [Neobacillus fumarioli]|uniref:hypothetical protein n=1 Tax=Neobacillus fumarioli TaxID=105229 RepID=UPI0008332D37|nr:hypothetical protein [Neobacillus fumarioli]